MRDNVSFIFFVALTMILLNVTVGDEIFCNFKDAEPGKEDLYSCYIESITNHPQNGNKIKGDHKKGKTHEDVKTVKRPTSSSLSMPRFDSIFCTEFPNVEHFDFEEMQPVTRVENALRDCKSLKHFSMCYAKINAVPEKFLPVPSKLSTLSFKNNKLTTLPELFLEHQHQLEQLILSGNQIHFIYPKTFNSLKNLRILKLDQNKIQTLDPVWFENLQNLEDLYLQKNMIKDIPQNAFKPLKNLRKLKLLENQITTIHSQSFGTHKHLKILSLLQNKIDAIDEKFIEKLFRETNDTQIDMTGNVCHGEMIERETQWKLQQCFENYQTNVLKIPKTTTMKNPPTPKNPCQPNPCGANSKCTEDPNGEPICSCIEGYLGAPPNCRPECSISSDCQTHLKCINEKCTDPCLNKCGENARCTVVDHDRVCNCLDGYEGDPLVNCQETEVTTITPESTTEQTSTTTEENEQQPSCGVLKVIRGDSVNGSYVQPHSYPWHAVLMKKNGDYFCSGTLVTSQKVVTAAHCIQDKHQKKALVPEDLFVLLGTHNLKNYSELGRINAEVSHIQMHEKWNTSSDIYDYDIAVIILARPVVFNDFIQPVCLIPTNDSIIQKSSDLGYIVGYEYRKDTDPHEVIPKIISVPMKTHDYCIKKHPSWAEFSSPRTLCGNLANETDLCGVINGGGVIVNYKGVYYLRAIYSASMKRGFYM